MSIDESRVGLYYNMYCVVSPRAPGVFMPSSARRPPHPSRQGTPESKPEPTTRMVDVHLLVGLNSEMLRMSAVDWFRLLHIWVLSEQTVVIRILKDTSEQNIVLRGGESGSLSLRKFNPKKVLTLATVMPAEEMRRQIESEQK